MSQGRWNNADEFILGGNRGHGHGHDHSGGFHKGKNDVETVVSPTENVVNPTTHKRTVRRVHPTHIKNVHKDITRVENYYPVTQSRKNINIVEEYDCGSDLHNPHCRRVDHCDGGCHH